MTRAGRLLLLGVVLAALRPALAEDDAAVRALAGAIGPDRGRTLLALARAAVVATAAGRPLPELAAGDAPRPGCGVFVTLVATGSGRGRGIVRGCYGDLNATDASLEEAVLSAARGAASRDPRSLPVRPDEVAGLTLVLSLTLPPEPVADARTVDPDRYGILVEGSGTSAVLLPGEARTASWGLDRTLSKAGLDRGAPVLLSRFRTLTFTERGSRS